jgi:hypothetical protein
LSVGNLESAQTCAAFKPHRTASKPCHSDRSEPTLFLSRSLLSERVGSRSGGTRAWISTPPRNKKERNQNSRALSNLRCS